MACIHAALYNGAADESGDSGTNRNILALAIRRSVHIRWRMIGGRGNNEGDGRPHRDRGGPRKLDS